MRDRSRQRENRRKKHMEKPWLNPEGYYDPTPYQALKNVKAQDSKKHNDRQPTPHER